MRCPRILACSIVRILARRSSRISSRKPSKPALKNTCRQESESRVSSREDRGFRDNKTCQADLGYMWPKAGIHRAARATHCRFGWPPCTGTHPCSALVGGAPTQGTGTAGHQISQPGAHRVAQQGLAAVLGGMKSGSSDLLLRPVSSQPASSSALFSPLKGHM